MMMDDDGDLDDEGDGLETMDTAETAEATCDGKKQRLGARDVRTAEMGA